MAKKKKNSKNKSINKKKKKNKIRKNVIKKHKKELKKSSTYITVKNKNNNEKILSSKVSPKTKNKIILSALITIIPIIIIIKIVINSPNLIFYNLKIYKVGEQLVLSDSSEWYVIEDSDQNEHIVKLLSKKPYDVNGDNQIDKNDKLSFDSEGSCNYNELSESNIGYFLQSQLTKKLKTIDGIQKVRLLASEEYIFIRNKMNFGYDWDKGNWLANKDIGDWWLATSNYEKIYTVTQRGSYRLYSPSDKNFVRIVIEIDKMKMK